MITAKLYRDKKKDFNTMQLNSMFENGNIDEETLKDIENFETYFECTVVFMAVRTHR